jgi:hypothetical protein
MALNVQCEKKSFPFDNPMDKKKTFHISLKISFTLTVLLVFTLVKTLYKKVDISLLTWGFTIPYDYEEDFDPDRSIRPGGRKPTKILLGNKKYSGFIYNKSQTKRARGHVYQVIWDQDRELVKKLRKTFIQTYIATSTQKDEALKVGKKKTRTRLEGAQELITIEPRPNGDIVLSVFFRVEDQWTKFLEKLVEENVFPWLMWGAKSKEDIYQRSTDWYPIKSLPQHASIENVIYYLADTKNKEFYVGKAIRLGDRVKPGRPEIPGWNKFRYDVVRPQYASLLPRLEENTIRALAYVLLTERHHPSLEISTYKLNNKMIIKL